jgi:hypothetical protein
MELQDALAQIADIRLQMARTTTFRGYRAVTTLFTSVLAIAAAAGESWWIPEPMANPLRFVGLWVCAAVICIVGVGAEILMRYRQTDSSLQRNLTILAIEQFLPSIIVGGMVTWILCGFLPQAVPLLPGLWSIFFGLGIMASRRLLPKPMMLVGAFYLICGLFCLLTASGNTALSAWTMAIPFGAGQFFAAAVLHWTLERNYAE